MYMNINIICFTQIHVFLPENIVSYLDDYVAVVNMKMFSTFQFVNLSLVDLNMFSSRTVRIDSVVFNV
jgi:hypothetical protein